MSSNNRTPASVLNAPTSVPVQVSEQRWDNRRARRHLALKPTDRVITIPRAFRQPATNIPHVRPADVVDGQES